MIVEHQFLNEAFFCPNWKIKHLFLGTFNPNGGENIGYFYGRSANYTWRVLSEIFQVNFRNLLEHDFEGFIKALQKHQIACMDMIRQVEFDENNININNIIGNGYKDSKIINNNVIRHYNTENIQQIIINNPDLNVYTTWGNGSPLLNWVNEINLIQNKINLVSPSRAARVPKGLSKFNYILNDWNNKIIL